MIAVVLLQPGKSAGISGSISGGAETFLVNIRLRHSRANYKSGLRSVPLRL